MFIDLMFYLLSCCTVCNLQPSLHAAPIHLANRPDVTDETSIEVECYEEIVGELNYDKPNAKICKRPLFKSHSKCWFK